MTAKLPPHQVVRVPLPPVRTRPVHHYQCCQPAAYYGSGPSASGLSLEEGIHLAA